LGFSLLDCAKCDESVLACKHNVWRHVTGRTGGQGVLCLGYLQLQIVFAQGSCFHHCHLLTAVADVGQTRRSVGGSQGRGIDTTARTEGIRLG